MSRKEIDMSTRAYSFILQFFLNMILPIGALAYGGYKLDQAMGTGFFVIIGFALGALVGITSIFKMASSFTKKDTLSVDFPVVEKRQAKEDGNEEDHTET